MNAKPATDEERRHFFELLKQFSTAMLVTHAGSDHLRARPMVIAQAEDTGKLWFITHVDTAKVHEIVQDTRVHLVCLKEFTAYLSMSGTATLVQSYAKTEELWQESFKVWFPEGKEDPDIALIAVTLDEVEFWDNQGLNKVSYLFEAAKAYVTGTTPENKKAEEHAFVKL